MILKSDQNTIGDIALPTTALSPLVSSTPNVSSDSVEGVGGVSPDRDWYVQSESRNLGFPTLL